LLELDISRKGGLSKHEASSRAAEYTETALANQEWTAALNNTGIDVANGKQITGVDSNGVGIGAPLDDILITREGSFKKDGTPSGGRIVKSVFSGGAQLAVGLTELYAEHETLATVGFNATKIALTGGPVKTVITKVIKAAIAGATDELISAASSFAEEKVGAFVTGLGFKANFSIGGNDVDFTSDMFGKAAGGLAGGIVEIVLDKGIDSVTKRGKQIEDISNGIQVGPHEVGKYKDVKGHHPQSQAARSNDPDYKPREVFSVKDDGTYDHKKISAKQRELYAEHRATGKPLTAKIEKKIEIESMIAGGFTKKDAKEVYKLSQKSLRETGASLVPTRIPGSRR
jgi:hypothetical protein